MAVQHRERPCGPTDKASDYGSEDSRFESWQGRASSFFFFLCLAFSLDTMHGDLNVV